MSDLGKQCWMMGIAVRGDMSAEAAERVVNAVISAIGMTKIYESKTWTYDGDLGLILAQPLYESIVTADFWPRHSTGYLVITSCKYYEKSTAEEAVSACGYEIIESSMMVLNTLTTS